MYGFSGARVRKALKKEYLLLENVKLKRSLGGTLTIIPVEVESDFFVNVSGSYYLLSRDDYRVLMETDDRERLTEHGFYEISLPEVRVAFIGRPLDFGTEGKTEYLATLLKTLDSSFLEGRITGIRASSRFNLSFIVDGKYDVMIGNVTDLDKKLETLERLMQKEVFASGSDVEVNLTDLSAPTTRAVDQINTEVAE